jgi:hypothetical protein
MVAGVGSVLGSRGVRGSFDSAKLFVDVIVADNCLLGAVTWMDQ